MVKKIIFSALIIFTNTVYASNQNIEYKGETITIPVSVEQTNRIVLPSRIVSKIVSKEKNVEIALNEREAFVKFSPVIEITKTQMEAEKEQKEQKREVKYQSNAPVEIYLLTEDKVTYSLILVPSKMDTQNIIINNAQQRKKELDFKESQLPLRNNLDDITKKVLTSKTLSGYEVQKRNEEVASSTELSIVLSEILKGYKFDVYKYSLINKTSDKVELQERDLIPLADNKSIYRIVIYYDNEVYEIPPRGTVQALIIVAAETEEVK